MLFSCCYKNISFFKQSKWNGMSDASEWNVCFFEKYLLFQAEHKWTSRASERNILSNRANEALQSERCNLIFWNQTSFFQNGASKMFIFWKQNVKFLSEMFIFCELFWFKCHFFPGFFHFCGIKPFEKLWISGGATEASCSRPCHPYIRARRAAAGFFLIGA